MRTYLGRLCPLSLAGIAVVAVLSARADDEALRRRVLDLNKITGDKVMLGEVDILSGDPQTKEIIKAALEIVKEKKQGLKYNAALVLAFAARSAKEFKSSETFFRICADQAAKLQSINKLDQAYGGLIKLFYNQKQYAEAAKVCRELIELRLDSGKDREELIGKTTRRGEFDYQRPERSAADGLRHGAYQWLIKSIAKQGKYAEALKMADKLIDSDKEWRDLEVKAFVQNEEGHYAAAAKTYEDMLKRVSKDQRLDPEDREAVQDEIRSLLSNLYLEDNRLDKASEQLQTLLKRHPDDPGYNNDLGYIWADHDVKLPEAEKLIRKALELDKQRRKTLPDITPEENHENGAYLDSLGWVYFKQKRYKEAKDVLLKAIEDKKSQHIEIYDHLGDVLTVLGERQAALEAWRKGLEFVTDSRRDQQRKAMVEKKLAAAK